MEAVKGGYMSLEQLAETFKKRGMEIQEKNDGSLVLPAVGRCGVHALIFFPVQDDWVQGQILFPVPRLYAPLKLGQTIAGWVPDDVIVSFTKDRQDLLFQMFVQRRRTHHAVKTLTDLADKMRPFTTYLVDHGRWNKEIVSLAFSADEGSLH